jgi:hypothetical protein
MAEVQRSIIYREIDGGYEPFLGISPTVPQDGVSCNFAIRQEDIWMYTPDKNPNFDIWMYQVCAFVVEKFGLGVVTSRRMAEIASTIEDGIDDLLNAPPEPPANSNMREAFEKTIEQAKKARDRDSSDVAISIAERQ